MPNKDIFSFSMYSHPLFFLLSLRSYIKSCFTPTPPLAKKGEQGGREGVVIARPV